MKRWIIIIVAILAAVAIGFGVFFGISATKNNNVDDKQNTAIRYLQDKDSFAVGESIVIRVIKSSDKELVKLAYSIDAGAEQEFTSTHGLAEDAKDTVGSGKFVIDTGTELIKTDALSTGWHTLVIYAYDAEMTRYIVTTTPILFQLTGANTAA